jgi:putative ABC transport system permease protein
MRFYRAVLRLYPRSFRSEYGSEILTVIADRRAIAGGAGARAGLALEITMDTLSNAARIHLDILRQDLRYTLRTLRRSPAFSVTAVMLTALGIGATTAAFAIADHVLVRPLPFREPDRLIRFQGSDRERGGWNDLSPGNFQDLAARSTAIEAAAAYTGRSANLVGHGAPVRLEGQAATGNLFEVLGVGAAIGRTFTAEDQHDGAPDVMVISYGTWRTHFAGDPSILGRTLQLNGRPHQVIGVMPEGFMFPNRRTEFWSVLRLSPETLTDRGDTYLFTVARLRPGRTMQQADAELDAICADLERQFPADNERLVARTDTLRGFLTTPAQQTLLAGMAAAAVCLLLIATTNLASLLLSRGLSRVREIAVRAAIGAGRERLVRQMMTESIVIAAIGGLLGIAIAAAAVPLLTQLVPTSLPLTEVPSIDGRFLALAASMTTLTVIAFGVLPARRAAAGVDPAALRESARVGSSRRTETLRSGLVAAQVALSVVLLVSVGLLGRALWRVAQTETGFRASGVLTMRTALPWPAYAEVARRESFFQRVRGDVRALPGVRNAAFITGLPMTMPGGIWGAVPEAPLVALSDPLGTSARFVTPGFFDTMSIPLKEGRDIAAADARDAPPVAVVSESFVRQAWPGSGGVGRRFTSVVYRDRVFTIVGVVGDIRVRGLEQRSEPQVYFSSQQMPDDAFVNYPPKELVVRADVAPASLLPAIRDIVRRADPEQPISNVRLLEEIVDEQIAPRAVQARVLGGFAAVAMLLASVGLYGLLAFSVSRRVREIGLRMALGATPQSMIGLVLKRGMLLALAGIAIGVAAAYGAGRWLEALLAGISPHDPAVFAFAIGIALLLAVAGTLLPAIRASRISPLEAARE